jgi:hypothetical protein
MESMPPAVKCSAAHRQCDEAVYKLSKKKTAKQHGHLCQSQMIKRSPFTPPHMGLPVKRKCKARHL